MILLADSRCRDSKLTGRLVLSSQSSSDRVIHEERAAVQLGSAGSGCQHVVRVPIVPSHGRGQERASLGRRVPFQGL